MMHKRLMIGCLASVAMLVSPQESTAIVIDNFTGGSGTIDTDPASPQPSAETDTGLNPLNTIGGQRSVQLMESTPNADLDAVRVVWNPPSDSLNFSSDAGAMGNLALIYNGGGNLGNVNLTQGGAEGISIVFPFAEYPSPLTIVVIDGPIFATATGPIPPSPGPQSLFIPFSSFTNQSALTSVDAIQIFINGASAGDLKIDLIETAVAPPPAGSCCLASGECVDGQTSSECVANRGTYQGDNTTCQPCPADIANNDNEINVLDLLFIIGSWGPCEGCP